MKKVITEIRSDYTDDQNYTHIDVWFNDEEDGQTIAIVDRDSKKVFWINNGLRWNQAVNEEITLVLNEISE